MKQIIKLLVCVLILTLCGASVSLAQNVQRQGNNFTLVKKERAKKEDKSQKTNYTYTDSKGVIHEIYLSERGKAFYYYTAKDGSRKKRYMPEIGKQINPSAYKE